MDADIERTVDVLEINCAWCGRSAWRTDHCAIPVGCPFGYGDVKR